MENANLSWEGGPEKSKRIVPRVPRSGSPASSSAAAGPAAPTGSRSGGAPCSRGGGRRSGTGSPRPPSPACPGTSAHGSTCPRRRCAPAGPWPASPPPPAPPPCPHPALPAARVPRGRWRYSPAGPSRSGGPRLPAGTTAASCTPQRAVADGLARCRGQSPSPGSRPRPASCGVCLQPSLAWRLVRGVWVKLRSDPQTVCC
jgi:hypothetical protein